MNDIDFYENNSDEYYERSHHLDLSHLYDLFCPLLSGKKILDFGCGTGRDSKHFFQKGYDVTALDGSEKMLAFTKKSCPDIKIVKSNFDHLPDDLGTFDGIWANASLVHLNESQFVSTLKVLKGNLRKNALLFISLKSEHSVPPRDEERRFTYWSPKQLKKTLKTGGYQILKLSTQSVGSTTWLNAISAVEKP